LPGAANTGRIICLIKTLNPFVSRQTGLLKAPKALTVPVEVIFPLFHPMKNVINRMAKTGFPVLSLSV
jgi:hypothetical protein